VKSQNQRLRERAGRGERPSISRCDGKRLCLPAVRKACGFPAPCVQISPVLAGSKAQPSSLRGEGWRAHSRPEKAKPFRTAMRPSRNQGNQIASSVTWDKRTSRRVIKTTLRSNLTAARPGERKRFQKKKRAGSEPEGEIEGSKFPVAGLEIPISSFEPRACPMRRRLMVSEREPTRIKLQLDWRSQRGAGRRRRRERPQPPVPYTRSRAA
jgi:hypothetical protein